MVAEEIRKLADHSAASVKEILEVLDSMTRAVEEMTGRIAEVAAIASQQSGATNEIARRMHNLEEAVEKLALSRSGAGGPADAGRVSTRGASMRGVSVDGAMGRC